METIEERGLAKFHPPAIHHVCWGGGSASTSAC